MSHAPFATSAAGSRAANSDWLARMARVGLAARGLIYVLVGVLAIEVARGGSARTDQKGALAKIAEQPFGRFLLWVVAAGMLAYGLWRLGEGIWGRREETDEKKRTLKRVESVASGVANIAISITAARFAMGSGGGGGKNLSSRLLDAPGGKTIMVIIGILIIGIGLALAWRGLKTDFEKQLKHEEMGRTTYTVVRRLGQAGYLARGLVAALIGSLVIKAALEQDPKKGVGPDAALRTLAEAPFGKVLLVLAAIGLICFGAYSFAESRYRRL
ncbi:MAG: DUF1206 domain-containing protein [Sporichthyaceae bacterium]